MLKQTKEILSFIKTDAKISKQEVKDAQYAINAIIYKRNNGYLAPSTATTIYNQFVEYGKAISQTDVSQKQDQHKQEVLTQLRKNCQSLKNYSKESVDLSDVPTIKKIMKYRIYLFLEGKKNNLLTDNAILEHLHAVKEIHDQLILPLANEFTTKEVKNFLDISKECLTLLYNRYSYEG